MAPTAVLQTTSALLLDLALAWALASVLAVRWLRGGAGSATEAWHTLTLRRLLAGMPAVVLSALMAYGAALWGAAAAMADVAPSQAGEALLTLLSRSSYGHIGLAGCGALALLAILYGAGQRPTALGSARDCCALLLLAVCMYSRAANSHAAEHGVFSAGVLVEWLHLLLICGWLGAVMLAAWLILPAAAGASAAAGTACQRYLNRLSHAATLALPGIAASGLYNAWRVFGAWDKVGSGEYETTLAIKLLLVAGAAALGGYNKFLGFPAAMAGRTGALARVTLIVQVEAVALIGALLAAVMLAGLPPPASL